jgi:hypothetical protein
VLAINFSTPHPLGRFQKWCVTWVLLSEKLLVVVWIERNTCGCVEICLRCLGFQICVRNTITVHLFIYLFRWSNAVSEGVGKYLLKVFDILTLSRFFYFAHRLDFLKLGRRFGSRLCFRLQAGKTLTRVGPIGKYVLDGGWIALCIGSTMLGVFFAWKGKQSRFPKRRVLHKNVRQWAKSKKEGCVSECSQSLANRIGKAI